jgi:sugar fermentation stimulation protein A
MVGAVKLTPHLREGRFLRRLNRFAGLVELGTTQTLVHIANTGRIEELLEEGRRVLVAPVQRAGRKTSYDLILVDLGHTLASADARLPPLVIYEALREGWLSPFIGYTSLGREATYGESRLDITLEGPWGRCFIEVKSITLVVDGMGLYPDAPTIRGRKHLHGLIRAVREGYRAAVIFVVQREDATAFSPNDAADPQFTETLRQAVREGVEVYAYKCRVTPEEIRLDSQLPVCL